MTHVTIPIGGLTALVDIYSLTSSAVLSACSACGLLVAHASLSRFSMADTSPTDSPRPAIPPEPELPYRAVYPSLEHHATALGYLCFSYSQLENYLNYLLGDLLRVDEDVQRAVVDASGASVETRCNLILKIASVNMPSIEYFELLDRLLNIIKSEISPKRNRYIHDTWIAGFFPHQIDSRAFLIRPQSRHRKVISETKSRHPSLEEIWKLVSDVNDMCGDIFDMRNLALGHRITKLPPVLPLPNRTLDRKLRESTPRKKSENRKTSAASII